MSSNNAKTTGIVLLHSARFDLGALNEAGRISMEFWMLFVHWTTSMLCTNISCILFILLGNDLMHVRCVLSIICYFAYCFDGFLLLICVA